MSEHILPAKTVALVQNTTVSLTWGAAEFAQAFEESIIKRQVAMRLSCSTTATKAVFIGVRYETLTKNYRVAEVPTISQIPASGSVEVTPASVGALGLLNQYILSVTVELTTQSTTGTATVALIIDDEPPPLSHLPNNDIGLNKTLLDDYIQVSLTGGGSAAPGTVVSLLYTVPAGKRFYLDLFEVEIEPTGSYPGILILKLLLTINGVAKAFGQYSEMDRWNVAIYPAIYLPLVAADAVFLQVTNTGNTNVGYVFNMLGREMF